MKLAFLLPTLVSLTLAASASALPNIILCMTDDQGWGDTGYNGHPHLKTPHLDQIAREGVTFTRCYSAAAMCSPTRGSIYTGRNPYRFGITFAMKGRLEESEIPITTVLKEHGYTTGHFGKWHLGSVRRGSPASPGANGFDHWVSAPNFYENDPIFSFEGRAARVQGESSMATMEAALSFIRTHAKKKPIFAVVWFGSPHGPHQAVEQDRAHYQKLPERDQHFLA